MKTTRELTREEGDALQKDMIAVLEKHGAEMGVIASIQLLKVIEEEEGIKSPFIVQDGGTEQKPETPQAD